MQSRSRTTAQSFSTGLSSGCGRQVEDTRIGGQISVAAAVVEPGAVVDDDVHTGRIGFARLRKEGLVALQMDSGGVPELRCARPTSTPRRRTAMLTSAAR